jgi:hypothetical protein
MKMERGKSVPWAAQTTFRKASGAPRFRPFVHD